MYRRLSTLPSTLKCSTHSGGSSKSCTTQHVQTTHTLSDMTCYTLYTPLRMQLAAYTISRALINTGMELKHMHETQPQVPTMVCLIART